MPLHWITGVPGSGKTTVLTRLSHLGFAVYDMDLDHIARWENTQTGETVEAEIAGTARPGAVAWRADLGLIADLASRARRKPIFLAGSVENKSEVLDLVDSFVWLKCSDEVIRERLFHRFGNSYGKGPGEITKILAWNGNANFGHAFWEATAINADQPIHDVVASVLKETVGKGLEGFAPTLPGY